MSKKRLIGLVILFFVLGSTSDMQAQDGSWWKKLFKKEGKHLEDKPESKEEVIIVQPEVPDKSEDKELLDTTSTEVNFPQQPGVITVHADDRIEHLSQKMLEDPEKMQGYRVQIFFGEYRAAKETRASFIREFKRDNCVIEHVPPMFSVRVGDYRTNLEAYKRLSELKDKYPQSIIVPSEINPPKL